MLQRVWSILFRLTLSFWPSEKLRRDDITHQNTLVSVALKLTWQQLLLLLDLLLARCSRDLMTSTYYVYKGSWAFNLSYPQISEVGKFNHMVVSCTNMANMSLPFESTEINWIPWLHITSTMKSIPLLNHSCLKSLVVPWKQSLLLGIHYTDLIPCSHVISELS